MSKLNKTRVPTEDEDLQNALEETDMMDDADFGQQEIGENWDEGLIDPDFDSDDDEDFDDDFEEYDDDEGYF